MRRFVIGLALGVLLSGCAAGREPSDQRLPAQAAAGRSFALRACAGCHAVGPEGASPNSQSQPFRILAGRLPGPSLEADLGMIAQRGHVQMPPIYMTPDEIDAVAAYIRAVAAAEPT